MADEYTPTTDKRRRVNDLTEIVARLEWAISVQLERPSNYDRRVVIGADDVLALIRGLAEEGADA